MWTVDNKTFKIEMTEGDYGIDLPIRFKKIELSSNDSIKIVFKTQKEDKPLIEKTFTNIENNVINLSFSAQETQKLSVGLYIYVMDWYKDGYFMCNLIKEAVLKVNNKA